MQNYSPSPASVLPEAICLLFLIYQNSSFLPDSSPFQPTVLQAVMYRCPRLKQRSKWPLALPSLCHEDWAPDSAAVHVGQRDPGSKDGRLGFPAAP